MQQKSLALISLGCAKNLVDAERMLYKLKESGYRIVPEAEGADVVVINTCGFIEASKQESIETILEIINLKNENKVKKIIVSGCLAQRYKEQIAEEFPEVDDVVTLEELPLTGRRILGTAPYTAYLKIAEGCSNRCSYCAIPLIRGDFRSVPFADVIDEAKELVRGGVTELNVIAQDTTKYGIDLYGEYKLPDLLKDICRISGLNWVRLLYCYPDRITDELLLTIKNEPKICNYIDIPVQHCNGEILSKMNRTGDKNSLTELFAKVRSMLPDVVLRTTLISGFPTETDEQFEEVCHFVKEVKFDRLGVFAYSREEDTPAFSMPQVDEDLRQRRADIIMQIQSDISQKINDRYIDKTLKVLYEGYDDIAKVHYGRFYGQAPDDIDGKVFFNLNKRVDATFGDFVNVKIYEATEYDLIGDTV
ncbi:MAG: MiaB/RimO family radical SAM methylthiotransferase [Ruminococcus sp.]|jgi:ribosomal protein S12 methylthiotransferase|nr:MiaB/RimO family radical SAM methylthiotransferase [Ruminococcus sp.]